VLYSVKIGRRKKISVNSCIFQILFRKLVVILEKPEQLSFLFEGGFVFLKFDKL